MTIRIEPMRGMCRKNRVDTGVDGIWMKDPTAPRGEWRVGCVSRTPNEPVILHRNVSKAIEKEIKRAVAKRDAEAAPNDTVAAMAEATDRPICYPPKLEDE